MSNQSNIKSLMQLLKNDKNLPISDYYNNLKNKNGNYSKENERIVNSLTSNTWNDDEDKKKALIAARYLNSVGKGENALELSYALEENLNKKDSPNYQPFFVPSYIKDAIQWICE
jgi:hypothetical protein